MPQKPCEPVTLEALAARLDLLLQTVRLSRKDVLRRFGWSDSTLRRRLRRGFPPPRRDELGKPYWTLPDLEADSLAGHVCPSSGSGFVRGKVSNLDS